MSRIPSVGFTKPVRQEDNNNEDKMTQKGTEEEDDGMGT